LIKETHVIINVLSSNVKESAREVRSCHSKAIVYGPQCRAEAIRNSRESTACCSVRLEHDKWFPKGSSTVASIAVLGDQVEASVMVEERRERFLRVHIRANTEPSEAIVARITIHGDQKVPLRVKKKKIALFHGDDLEAVLEPVQVASRPKSFGLPRTRGETGTYEHVLDRDVLVVLDGFHKRSKFLSVLVNVVRFNTMLVTYFEQVSQCKSSALSP